MWCWFVQLLGCPDVSLSRRSSYFVVRLKSCWVVLLTDCLMLDEQFNEIYTDEGWLMLQHATRVAVFCEAPEKSSLATEQRFD